MINKDNYHKYGYISTSISVPHDDILDEIRENMPKKIGGKMISKKAAIEFLIEFYQVFSLLGGFEGFSIGVAGGSRDMFVKMLDATASLDNTRSLFIGGKEFRRVDLDDVPEVPKKEFDAALEVVVEEELDPNVSPDHEHDWNIVVEACGCELDKCFCGKEMMVDRMSDCEVHEE